MSGGAGGSSSSSSNVALSAKGDLLTFNTASARLPVTATNGFVLTSNSAVADGIEWAVIPIATAQTQSFITACSDETSDLTTGVKSTWRTPYAFTVSSVRASLTTAATGAALSVDILQNGVSILATRITIDVSTTTSIAAAVQPVLTTSALTNDSIITIDVIQVGSTIAGAGLKVAIIGSET